MSWGELDDKGKVTPFAGVWIETFVLRWRWDMIIVTPFAGVWIETIMFVMCWVFNLVTPFAGVWIETRSLP